MKVIIFDISKRSYQGAYGRGGGGGGACLFVVPRNLTGKIRIVGKYIVLKLVRKLINEIVVH